MTSWLWFPTEKGATSLTESWAALETVSNNHLMLGHLMEWFYSGLAGIRQDENSVAFKEIILKPEPVEGITLRKQIISRRMAGSVVHGGKIKTVNCGSDDTGQHHGKSLSSVAPGSTVTESGMQVLFQTMSDF
jgi:hypothetical protein